VINPFNKHTLLNPTRPPPTTRRIQPFFCFFPFLCVVHVLWDTFRRPRTAAQHPKDPLRLRLGRELHFRPKHRNVRFPLRGHLSTGSGSASAMRRGHRERPRRLCGRARAALRDAGCQRVRWFCGGCRAPCRPAHSCLGSTQDRRRPATCMYAFRPLRACALSTPGHGHQRGTHTPRLRSSRSCPRAADTVCARQAGRPSRVLSLTHTLTVAVLWDALSHDCAPGAGAEDCITRARRLWRAQLVGRPRCRLTRRRDSLAPLSALTRCRASLALLSMLSSGEHCPMTMPRVLVLRTASPEHADFGGLSSLDALVVVRLVVVPLSPRSPRRRWRVGRFGLIFCLA